MRMLIVDDDAASRKLTGLWASMRMGATAVVAASGEEALKAPGPFDAVIADERLPGMAGTEMLEALGAAGGLAEGARVVVLSASPGARPRGPVGSRAVFLLKPVKLSDLAAVVRGEDSRILENPSRA